MRKNTKILNLDTIRKIDISSMHQVYNGWPETAESAFKSQVEPIQITDIDHVIFAGMGVQEL